MQLRYRVQNWYYYLKCRLFKRYNVLHIQTLPPTFTDRDTVLSHAIFQILSDFVTKECGKDCCISWDQDDEHKQVRQKMDELLDWWHNAYLKFDCMEGYDRSKATPDTERFVKSEYGDYSVWNCNEYDKEFFGESGRKEAQMEKSLNQKLKEILELRLYLWT